MDKHTVWAVAHYLRSAAEHYPPEDYRYTRNLGKLESIRYTHDYQGPHSWTRRLRRVAGHGGDLLRTIGKREDWDEMDSLIFGKESERSYRDHVKHCLATAYIAMKLELKRNKHLPEGVLAGGSIITFQEENGEYLQLVQPTTGSLLADFLDSDPEHPRAQALAAEMKRIIEDYYRRNDGSAAFDKTEFLEYATPEGYRGHALLHRWRFGLHASIFLQEKDGTPHHWLSARLQGLETDATHEEALDGVLNVVAGAEEETIYRVEANEA